MEYKLTMRILTLLKVHRFAKGLDIYYIGFGDQTFLGGGYTLFVHLLYVLLGILL